MGAGYATYAKDCPNIPSFQSYYPDLEDDFFLHGPIHSIVTNSSIRKSLVGNLIEMATPSLTLQLANQHLPEDSEIPQNKDAKFSSLMRSKADDFYQKILTSEFYPFADGEALEACNIAILFAPTFSEEYALALATRSSVYLQIGQDYKRDAKELQPEPGKFVEEANIKVRELLECSLIDATVALTSPEIPIQVEEEVRVKIGKVQMKLGRPFEAEKMWEKLRNTLQHYSELDCAVNPGDVKHLSDQLVNSINKHNIHVDSSCRDPTENNTTPLLDLNESDKVKAEWGEQKGRCMVVTAEEVKKGSVLIREKPFASVLHKEFEDSHCSHCHKELRHSQFYPCSHCVEVKYCSTSCASKAYSSYHKTECGFLSLLHANIAAHLALRIVLTAGKDRVLRCCSGDQQLRDGKGSTACLKDSVPFFSLNFECEDRDYLRVLSLVDNMVVMDQNTVALHWLAAISLASLLLEKTDFFHESVEEDREEEAAIVAGAILRHICQVICNSLQISHLDYRTEQIATELLTKNVSSPKQKPVAIAIFPSSCLINHSCDPNVLLQFADGNEVVIRSMKDLVIGDEVLTSYGPTYRDFPVMKRQEILRDSFFFVCRCEMCIQEMKSNFSFPDKFVCASNCTGPLFLIDDKLYCGSCSDVSGLDALSFLTRKA